MAFCLERGSQEALRGGRDDAFGGEDGSHDGGREEVSELGRKGGWDIR